MNPRLHILHLEDDPADAELLQAAFESASMTCQITRVQTRDEYSEALCGGRYDVILSDYRLPQYDGMSALRLALEVRPDVPFIFVSGTMGEDAAIEGLTEGATDYVLKQKLSRLVPAVRRALRDAVNRRERKRAEDALRLAKEEWERTFDAVPDLVCLLDRDYRVQRANRAMCTRLGVTPEQAVGMHCCAAVHGTDKPPPFCPHAKLLTDGTGHTVEVEEPRLGGCFLVSVSPVHDAKGQVVGAVHIARDITVRKRAEEERSRLQAQLLQSQKLEAIGTLAGGIAHDFNNILQCILWGVDTVARKTADRPEVRAKLDLVLSSALRAADLVKQILTFSRRNEPKHGPLALWPLVKEAVNLLRASVPANIEVRLRAGTATATVLADATQIHQVIMNLCTNAVHAMEGQGGVLTLDMGVVTLDAVAVFPGLPPGSYAELVVTDTGTGIRPEIRESIFDPFFTTKGPGKGTGLGLAVVHGIVRSHGGAITVDSTVGKGSAFRVLLPLVHGVADQLIPIAGATLTGTEHILFVDDDQVLVNHGRDVLEAQGYTVTTSVSAIEALELFRQAPDRFDLVITDQGMPHLTGCELAQRLLVVRPDLPIILSSGAAGLVSAASLAAAGIRAVLAKPCSPDRVAEAVRGVLDVQAMPESNPETDL